MNYPRKIAIGFQEGTCPLTCAKCLAFSPNAKEKKKAVKMPLDKALYLIDEVAAMEKVPVIQPHIFTEPFANQDLRVIMQRCMVKKIGMSIITNGILLNQEWLDFLINELDRTITLSFSLDAVSQEVYQKVRGNYELKQLEDKIEYLVKNRKKSGPRVSVNFSTEEDNCFEADDFIEKWKYKTDSVRVDTVFDSDKKISHKFVNEDVKNGNMKCGFLNEVMVVDADGQIRVCQLDAFGDTSFGNAFEEDLLSIWNGVKLNKLRTEQAEGTLEKANFCYGCEVPCITNHVRYETDDFVILKAGGSIYYNYKGEIA